MVGAVSTQHARGNEIAAEAWSRGKCARILWCSLSARGSVRVLLEKIGEGREEAISLGAARRGAAR